MSDEDTPGTTTRERAIGALLGLAAGDAVGTTLEFRAPGSFEPITDLVGGGPFAHEPGQWTDDTAMAMCLAESILDTGGLDPADQLRRYVQWYRTGYWSATGVCDDIGITTTAALVRFERDGSVTDAEVHQHKAANGSLMRLAPVPIRWFGDPAVAAEHSAASSRTTHPADRPVDACRVYGAMLAALIGGTPLAEVLDPGFWRYGPIDDEIEAVVRGSWQRKEPPEIRGDGFVVRALEAAIWAVAGATDFRDAVLRAANLGDDADTTAAIAGQLAGAWWGVEGIPASWRAKLTAGERIAAIAGRLHDAALGTSTYVVTAASTTDPGTESTVTGPVADVAAGALPERWAHDATCHAWRVSSQVLAGEYPGAPQPVKAREKIDLLVDHGVRTFVDLTTPADGLAPYEAVLDGVATADGIDLDRISCPIPDVDVLDDDAGYDAIVDAVRAAAARGGVYVHCWGGVGRTATVVGCLLVDAGFDGPGALERIRSLRAGSRKAGRRAPETDAQDAVVLRRAERNTAGPPDADADARLEAMASDEAAP